MYVDEDVMYRMTEAHERDSELQRQVVSHRTLQDDRYKVVHTRADHMPAFEHRLHLDLDCVAEDLE